MKTKKYDLNNKEVQYLISTDKKLEKLIRYLKSCSIMIEEDDFKCLVKYIIGQQISDKTREVIWNKLCIKYRVSPKTMIGISEEELKSFGICRQKVIYIKNLANAIIDKQIDFKEFKNLTSKEIIDKLVKIKGIGNWTVEMYLIFSLGREDILSKGDNTIKRVLKWMYNLNELPSSKEVEKYFSKWLQYSTIVSAYFWEAIAKNLLNKNINDLN